MGTRRIVIPLVQSGSMGLKNCIYGCFLLFGTVSFSLDAKSIIRVGGYLFPPFVFSVNTKEEGLTKQFIHLMNKVQNEYEFVFIPTSSKRRYRDFKHKKFDIIIFEDKHWGWQKYPVENTFSFLKGGEVYITKRTPTRTQAYFNNLKNKSIRGYIGYHYAFSDYITDKDILKKKYNMIVTRSHSGNIRSVIKGRADIAIVSKAYLQYYFLKYPDSRKQILISQRLDQTYNHAILFRQNGPISQVALERILHLLLESKEFRQLVQRYQLQR